MLITEFGIFLILYGMIAHIKGLQYISTGMVVCTVFGAASAFFIAGKPFQPSIFFVVICILYMLRYKFVFSKLYYQLHHNSVWFWLFLMFIYSCIITIIIPVFFAGLTTVYLPFNDAYEGVSGFGGFDLKFTMSNVSQLLYLFVCLISYVVFLFVSSLNNGLQILAKAIIAVSFLNSFFAFVDIVGFYLGIESPLSFIKNSTYAMVDQNINGIRRISGSFSEPSYFSFYTSVLLVFTLMLWKGSLYKKISAMASIIAFVFLVLSTSTTAYFNVLMIAFLFIFLDLGNISKGFIDRYVVLLFIGCAFLVLLSLFFYYDQVLFVVEESIFNKMGSSSGVERLEWSLHSLKQLTASYGFGIGLGSSYSNGLFFILLSSIGMPGLVMFLFVILNLVKNKTDRLSVDVKQRIQYASMVSAIMSFVFMSVSSTVLYNGLLPYILLAMATSRNSMKGVGADDGK